MDVICYILLVPVAVHMTASIIVTCLSYAAKLIRVFYAMLTKGVDYDPKKMVSDIKRPAVYLQAA